MGEIREPYRPNIYECVKKTCLLSQRTIYLNRIIYCGEHQFGEKCEISFPEAMEQIVETVNSEYCYDPLTGLLLLYPNYFVHLIDGSEDSLTKHFKLLLENYKEFLGRMKILVVYNHINQRFFNTWAFRSGKPPTLLEKISAQSDQEECFRQLQICIQKVYDLAKALRVEDMESKGNIGISEIQFYMAEYLPEYLLLDFLLGLEYLDDVESYANIYMTVPGIELKEENVWPIRLDFIPRDIFDTDIEIIPELPEGGEIKSNQQKQQEEITRLSKQVQGNLT